MNPDKWITGQPNGYNNQREKVCNTIGDIYNELLCRGCSVEDIEQGMKTAKELASVSNEEIDTRVTLSGWFGKPVSFRFVPST